MMSISLLQPGTDPPTCESTDRSIEHMRLLLFALVASVLLTACGKEEPDAQARPPAPVTVLRIEPRDTPVTFEYVGQTESTRQVQIRARVDGFLDSRVYREGSLVKAGDLMFLQDPKPFQAALDAAQGALAQQEARLQTARDNLKRVRPLTAQKALSEKDLDDAIGQEQAAAAAVDSAKANVQQAELNLGYTKITTPVTGLASFAKVQDGSYVSSANSLLTYVARIDTLWVNFSVSENDILDMRSESAAGLLHLPPHEDFLVEIVLSNGSVFPNKGRITFRNADYDVTTGTFLLRATFDNPDAALRPGQFVRVRIFGAVRPKAILVPQQAVLQGANGHFVMVVDKDDQAQVHPVEVGTWYGNDWFITSGLSAGDLVVTDGMAHLTPGAKVRITKTLAGDQEGSKSAPPDQSPGPATPENETGEGTGGTSSAQSPSAVKK
jgi:membrane fusion protein (multidrug efflux system)